MCMFVMMKLSEELRQPAFAEKADNKLFGGLEG